MAKRVTLWNFERIQTIGVVDVGERKLVEEFESAAPLAEKAHGQYLVVDGQLIALFRNDDHMNLLVGNCLYEDLDRITCNFTKAGTWPAKPVDDYEKIAYKESRLEIYCDGKAVHDLAYTPIDYGVPAFLDFTMFDWEDFDILLFLRNVLRDPDRRNRCFIVRKRSSQST